MRYIPLLKQTPSEKWLKRATKAIADIEALSADRDARNKLIENNFQFLGVNADRIQSPFEPLRVPVVIRPPNIDHALETTSKFIIVIGNIGREIRGRFISFFQNAILIISKFGGLKPDGTLALIGKPFCF